MPSVKLKHTERRFYHSKRHGRLRTITRYGSFKFSCHKTVIVNINLENDTTCVIRARKT